MPIRTLDRRLREVGRIRLGHRKNGTGHPVKGETFRLTSQAQNLIEAAAGIWGGQPRQWTAAPVGTQWELFTDATELRVVIPPDRSLSQWMERWSGGGCQIRCDGRVNVLNDEPCEGQDEHEGCPAGCRPTTRLNVLLPDLPDLGVWRLESHGYYAAVELAGTAELLASVAASGRLAEATLRLEQREIKRPGQPPMRFPVPALAVTHRLGDFLAPMLASNGAAGALPASRGELAAPETPPGAEKGEGSAPGGPPSDERDDDWRDAEGAFAALGINTIAAVDLLTRALKRLDEPPADLVKLVRSRHAPTALAAIKGDTLRQAVALVNQEQRRPVQPAADPVIDSIAADTPDGERS